MTTRPEHLALGRVDLTGTDARADSSVEHPPRIVAAASPGAPTPAGPGRSATDQGRRHASYAGSAGSLRAGRPSPFGNGRSSVTAIWESGYHRLPLELMAP